MKGQIPGQKTLEYQAHMGVHLTNGLETIKINKAWFPKERLSHTQLNLIWFKLRIQFELIKHQRIHKREKSPVEVCLTWEKLRFLNKVYFWYHFLPCPCLLVWIHWWGVRSYVFFSSVGKVSVRYLFFAWSCKICKALISLKLQPLCEVWLKLPKEIKSYSGTWLTGKQVHKCAYTYIFINQIHFKKSGQKVLGRINVGNTFNPLRGEKGVIERCLFIKLLIITVMGLRLSLLLLLISLAGNEYHCHSSKILPCVKEIISLGTRPTIATTLENLSGNNEEILKFLRFSKDSEQSYIIPFCTVWHWPANKEEKKTLWGRYPW